MPARAGEPDPDDARDETAGSVGIQLLDAPVSRRGDPRALRYVIDHLPPGAVIHRDILIANKTRVPRHVELYPAAATIEHGRFVFGADRTVNELTSWISLDRWDVDLAPGEDARVTMTLTVPQKASSGERYAVLWAAVTSDPGGGDVRQAHRVGVRVYLGVGVGGEPASSFVIAGFTPTRDQQGRPSVGVEVTNTGGRAIDLSGSVTLTEGPAGMRAGPFDVQTGTTLAPGHAGTVTVRLPQELPDGPWTIAVHLESGMVTNSMTSRITFSNSGEADTGMWSTRWLPAWSCVLALAVLTVAGLVRDSRHAVPRRGRRVRDSAP